MAGADNQRNRLSIAGDLQRGAARRAGLSAGLDRSPMITNAAGRSLASFKSLEDRDRRRHICMSLPAGPMIRLTSALAGIATSGRPPAANERSRSPISSQRQPQCAGARRPVCARSISRSARAETPLGVSAISLTPLGRSAALLIAA